MALPKVIGLKPDRKLKTCVILKTIIALRKIRLKRKNGAKGKT